MFRDGIFENFGDFLDKIKESVTNKYTEEEREPFHSPLSPEEQYKRENASELARKVIDFLVEEEYDIEPSSVGPFTDQILEMSPEEYSQLEDDLRYYNTDDVLSYFSDFELKKKEPTLPEGKGGYVCVRCGSKHTAEVEGKIKCLKCGHIEDIAPGEKLNIPPVKSESKLEEPERKDAEQTMKPQEETPKEDAERLSMEDWSDTDKEGKPKRKDKVEYPSKLQQLEDRKVMKENRKDPLYLCNSCFKTFRSKESKCAFCESREVEKIVNEIGSDVPFYKNIFVIKYKLDGKEQEARIEAHDKADAEKQLKKTKTNISIISTEKIKEERGEVNLLKKVFSVSYTKDGKERETRVMAFDEEDAKRLVRDRLYRGCEVIKVQKIGESKVNETVQELVGETPGINLEDQKILNWAIENEIISNEWPDNNQMIDELSQREELDFGLSPEEWVDELKKEKGLGEVDPSGLDLGEIQAVYLKYILLPKAKKEFSQTISNEMTKIENKSKLREQEEDSYVTTAKGIEDKGIADEIARKQKGNVIPDPADPKKFAVVVRKE